MSKKCMYARSKYNYTPSDYDLIFDYTKIPSNINMEDASNLTKRLQQYMPLSKTIHLNLNTNLKECGHQISINTSLQLTMNTKKITVNII